MNAGSFWKPSTTLGKFLSDCTTKTFLIVLVLTLWTLMILMSVVLGLSGHEAKGICGSLSLSTIDQPGGYAVSIGVSPCPGGVPREST